MAGSTPSVEQSTHPTVEFIAIDFDSEPYPEHSVPTVEVSNFLAERGSTLVLDHQGGKVTVREAMSSCAAYAALVYEVGEKVLASSAPSKREPVNLTMPKTESIKIPTIEAKTSELPKPEFTPDNYTQPTEILTTLSTVGLPKLYMETQLSRSPRVVKVEKTELIAPPEIEVLSEPIPVSLPPAIERPKDLVELPNYPPPIIEDLPIVDLRKSEAPPVAVDTFEIPKAEEPTDIVVPPTSNAHYIEHQFEIPETDQPIDISQEPPVFDLVPLRAEDIQIDKLDYELMPEPGLEEFYLPPVAEPSLEVLAVPEFPLGIEAIDLEVPVEIVEQTIIHLTEAIELMDEEETKIATDILDQIVQIIAEQAGQENLPLTLESLSIEDRQELTSLFSELFEFTGVEYSDQLIEAYIKLVLSGDLPDITELQPTDDFEEDLTTTEGIGTHEIIRRLMTSAHHLKQLAKHAYYIGRSALELYFNPKMALEV